VNLILFEPTELDRPLPREDPRAQHLCDVLRRRRGDLFDVGLVDGPRGKGTLLEVGADALTLSFAWGAPLPPLDPLELFVGLPRPQTARKILQEATTLGVTALHFVVTERADPQYAQSTLWSSGEWRRHLLAGAAQAFDPRLPLVTWGHSLAATMTARLAPAAKIVSTEPPQLLALDNYEATVRFGACEFGTGRRVILALGPERGWGPADRAELRGHGFTLAHLGERVLRAETAVVAALAILRARAGLI